jgi:hypothetical protein
MLGMLMFLLNLHSRARLQGAHVVTGQKHTLVVPVSYMGLSWTKQCRLLIFNDGGGCHIAGYAAAAVRLVFCAC